MGHATQRRVDAEPGRSVRADTLLRLSVKPLRERKLDVLFIACFAFGAFSCLFSDLYAVMGWLEGEGFWAQANRYYLEGDPFLASHPYYMSIVMMTSAFVWLPFYLVFIYALVRGCNWVRPLALLYVGGITVNMVNFFWFEFAGPLPPTEHLAWVLGWNLPYLIVPLLFGLRMWRHEPFSA